MKALNIKLTKCTLILTEYELLNGLKEEILLRGIKRGKAHQRQERVKRYEEEREKINADI